MQNYLEELKNCNFCPRECHTNRVEGNFGYCNCDASFSIGSICLHNGEEPVISGKNGICNVFFTHCNLQCIFCQNYQISRNKFNENADIEQSRSKHFSPKCNNENGLFAQTLTNNHFKLEEVVNKIIAFLDKDCNLLGFVSPSHCIPQMKAIIYALHEKGRSPVIVFNTNAYDKVDTLQSLESLIDVYLPDFKYSDPILSKELSDAENYPEIALNAIKEMVRQKGTSLRLSDEGLVESGVIIRHLILPGYVENSKKVLQLIANEISTNMNISLMSQYFPVPEVFSHPKIGKKITEKEYSRVINEMEKLGFYRGWVQEYSSSEHYLPDFLKDNPFE